MSVMGHMTEWMWIGMGLMALFWIVAIVVGVWAIRRATSRPSGNALRILEARFARGEIDQEEFIRRREAMVDETRQDPTDRAHPTTAV